MKVMVAKSGGEHRESLYSLAAIMGTLRIVCEYMYDTLEFVSVLCVSVFVKNV